MNATFTPGHPEPEQVMTWIDGESVDGEMAHHLEACDRCRAVAADLRIVGARLAAWTVEPATLAAPHPRTFSDNKWRYIGMAALLLISLLAWSTVHEWKPATTPAHSAVAPVALEDRAAFERDWAARPRVDVDVPPDGAAVVVVVFLDWQCPTCTHLEYAPVLESYEAAHPGAVRYVVKDYPLDAKCNANIPGNAPPHHPAACEAAAAVRMARDRGRANEFIDWIFSNQRDLTPERVRAQAASMLGVKNFEAEYAAKLRDIERDVTDGGRLHVQFTPTVYVNGVLASLAGGGPPSPQQLEWAIQYELLRARR
jgi:protein-disulfide isomerase